MSSQEDPKNPQSPDQTSDPDDSATASATSRQESPRPKDRNQRVREQAERKIEEARRSAAQRASRIGATGLDAGEMVDDALARGFSTTTKWLRRNRRALEYGLVGIIVIGIGYAVWDWRSNKNAEAASAALMTGVQDESARVVSANNPEPQQDEEEAAQAGPTFPSYDARRDASLNAYRAAANQYTRSGAGILARLGEAGVLLDKRDFDGALKAFGEVLASPLAQADADVRMNAKEGQGLALEGKGDKDGALNAFKELESSGIAYYRALGMYHQARVLLAKGQKDAAKDLLQKVRGQLTAVESKAPTPRASEYILKQVNEMLRQIDPSLVPASNEPGSGGNQMSPAQLKMLQEQIARMRQQQQQQPPSPQPPPSGAAPTTTAPASSNGSNK